MAIVIVTGSAGLIGAEATRYFHAKGLDVVGIDNDMRRYFFGDGASTRWSLERLARDIPAYRHHAVDIRDAAAIEAIFEQYGADIAAVVHTAAQPSHDWAAREPATDFTTNANGTLNLLEATRKFCGESVFIFTSTNKVYGDTPNALPLVELETRWELSPDHPWAEHGIPESMSIDHTLHSLFGASKVAADVLVQEYGRYFGMRTAVFRGGCLTGPGHSGAELHGFLSYLMKCAVAGKPYTVFGYKGKQVRDNIHSHDLVSAFWQVFEAPRPGAVYNMGGGRHSNCSMLEAIRLCEELTGRPMDISYRDDNRVGDHIWWISDIRAFRRDYPGWSQRYDLRRIMEDIFEGCREQSPAG
ncbi:NAD-dependent epimerase/dehydratase family protein [Skermanella rosea]|uniref:NAD-dependent epimerase/dehydratase family protein n=1 Tax=Skermanella rosea TaxID=1817965 RepID=UPI0019336B05|nr:NAD-dependent epimerase/dehydratase family protein [Skermanella rosea]UEM05379.1 NAD-dependent epimerase/dehydratase family protein [Skermanella rosea]